MKTGIAAALAILLTGTAALADTYRIDTVSPFLPATQAVVVQSPVVAQAPVVVQSPVVAPTYVESYSPVVAAPVVAPTVVYSPAPYYAWQIPSYFYVPGRTVVRERTFYRPRGVRTVVRYW